MVYLPDGGPEKIKNGQKFGGIDAPHRGDFALNMQDIMTGYQGIYTGEIPCKPDTAANHGPYSLDPFDDAAESARNHKIFKMVRDQIDSPYSFPYAKMRYSDKNLGGIPLSMIANVGFPEYLHRRQPEEKQLWNNILEFEPVDRDLGEYNYVPKENPLLELPGTYTPPVNPPFFRLTELSEPIDLERVRPVKPYGAYTTTDGSNRPGVGYSELEQNEQ